MNLATRFVAPPLERAALITGNTTITYAELAQRVDRWRGALVADGLSPGDRVVLLAGNSETFVVGYLACLTAGLITVPLNPQSPGPELDSEIKAVTPKAVIVAAEAEAIWGKYRAAFAASGSTSSADSQVNLEFVGQSGLDRLDAGVPTPVVEVADDAVAVLLFTSGTAGQPKPAILTHGNLASSLAAIIALPIDLVGFDHTVLGIIPLFHVFGLNIVINLSLLIGATIVLEDHVDPARTCALIKDNRVTIAAGPPTFWASLLTNKGLTNDHLASVKLALSGASKLDPVIGQRLSEGFGLEVREGYGLTETSGIVSSAMGTDAPLGSVGQILPGVQARLVDGDGNDVLVGDEGEILVTGPMVSPGYWGDDEASARTRTEDGWLRTGDLAVVDDDGNLAIVDRLKDLIIVSGFNIHPAEIEAVLNSHSQMATCGVVGELDEVTGERPVAYVVLSEAAEGPAPTPEELRNFCAERLARYKVPRRIEIVAGLPMTATGKVRRQELGKFQ